MIGKSDGIICWLTLFYETIVGEGVIIFIKLRIYTHVKLMVTVRSSTSSGVLSRVRFLIDGCLFLKI